MSIRTKCILILVFCIAALAAGFSYAVCHFASKEADAAFAHKASAQLDRVDDIIHIYFKSAEQAVKNLAALPGLQDIALARATADKETKPSDLDAALTQVLGALPSLVPGVESAFCGYKNGSFHSSSPSPRRTHGDYDARTQSWYSDTAWGAADSSVTGIAISDTSKSLAATVAAKIKDAAGETLGVAALAVNLGPLLDTLRDVRLGRSGHLVLFDEKGRVLFDPMAQENLLLPAAEAGSRLLTLMQLPAGRHTITEGSEKHAVFSRVFSDNRWKAALIMDDAERAATGTRVIYSMVAVAAAAAILFALLGVGLIVGATRPLYALIRQSKALADGNEEALGGISGRGPDITELQGNIGRLTGRVMLLAQAEREHAGKVEAHARKAFAAKQAQIEQNATEAYRGSCRAMASALAPIALETAAIATTMNGWIAKIQDHVRTQSLAARSVRAATLALECDAATVARQAAETEKTAGAALNLARKTDRLSRDTARAIESMTEAAQALAPGLEAIKADSDRMAELTAGVRDVAEEINVVGLKLSIEVSSAGEAGKKFFPVAEEMRHLAEKAMTAAGSMDGVVASIKQSHAAHALASGKTPAAAKRASSGGAKLEAAIGQAASAALTTVEQISVLATTLEGLAQTDDLKTNDADAILSATSETGDALGRLDDTAAALTALATRLTALAATFTAPLDESGHCLPTPHSMQPPQKQLD